MTAWEEFMLRLLGAACVAALIKGGVALSGHSIHWGWCVLIGAILVFGGWLIIDGDVID